jgi:hypothetical protein
MSIVQWLASTLFKGLKNMSDVILEAKQIKKYFPIRKGFFMREVG